MNEDKKQSIRDAYAKFKKDPDQNQEVLIKKLEDMRTKWVAERQKSNEGQWKTIAAFYAGDQFIRDAGGGSYRVRVKENHLNNIMNRMLSIFMQNMPITRVFPNSTDYGDTEKAGATEQWIKYYHRKQQMELKFMKFVKYSCGFGSSFMWAKWNPDLGGKILLDKSETTSGEEELKAYRGDEEVKVLDPFKVAVRPGIDELDDMYDVIVSEPVSRWSIEAEHGEIEAASAKVGNAHNGDIREDDDTVMQHHYYHPPTPWFEEGLYVCWAGKKILKAREATSNEIKIPLVHLPFDRPFMKFYGMSSLEQVVDLQEQLNRAAGMIIEARNLVARPRWSAPAEANVPANALTDQPGSYLKWKGNPYGGPKIEVPSFNFGEMQAHKSDIREAIGQVVGIQGASRGELPAQMKTALALQLVLEQDRSQYLPFIKTYHAALLRTNEQICMDAAEFIAESDPRSIKIEGMEGCKPFHGGMVPTPLDMYMEDTNPLGWTAGARIENTMELVSSGLISDKNKALEMLHMHNDDPAYKIMKINRQAALKEIDLLNKGQMLEIGPEDNDETHLDEHIPFIASFNFRKLPPAVQTAHRAHAEQHKARFGQSMGGAPGAPPEGGAMGGKPQDPAAMGSAMQAPQPGQNMEALLQG